MVTKNDLIQPLFVKEGLSDKEPIESMPGIFRFGEESILKEIEEIDQLGIKAIAIFPVIDPSKKDSRGTEATKRDNFISRVLSSIKNKFPDMLVIADVALDPYTDHGHDGVFEKDKILNDQTLEVLAEQSLVLAEAGADIIAPSDMMDGRIGFIRRKLDENNFQDKIILSYAAKYNSKFYGPFRDAVNSKNNLGTSDKSSYQMNPANSLEALNEVAMDIEEGADIVMVKPGMPYLDIISKIKEEFKVPTFAYQVSGEYAMIMESVNKGWLDKGVIIESLTSFKRAGADAVLTYFAKDLIKEFNL
jgi:porphobilinogen synthase|tara:strand:+ start:442 stop:1353 length:912 start_codon:yes stop_codon:yes gene_type:complete